jgi:hypothetical protein
MLPFGEKEMLTELVTNDGFPGFAATLIGVGA